MKKLFLIINILFCFPALAWSFEFTNPPAKGDAAYPAYNLHYVFAWNDQYSYQWPAGTSQPYGIDLSTGNYLYSELTEPTWSEFGDMNHWTNVAGEWISVPHSMWFQPGQIGTDCYFPNDPDYPGYVEGATLCAPPGGVPPCADADGDDIPDDVDPYPDDPKDFLYHIKSYQLNGGYSWVWIEYDNGTDREFGVFDDDLTTYLNFEDWSDAETYKGIMGTCDTIGEVDLPEGDGSNIEDLEQISIPASNAVPDVVPGLETPNDNTGNSIDTDYLHDIVKNTGSGVLNQQKIIDYLAGINTGLQDLKKIEAIGQANDTSPITNVNVDVDNSGIESRLDTLSDKVQNLNDGNYSPDAMGDAYTTETFDFGGRTNTFFDDLKNTALFSLPSRILSDIPDSSNSTMSFDGGVYGQHTYDFASLGSIYVTLRAILLTLFGYLSVRIVVLKR